jgi:ribosome-binding factor A
MSKSNNEKPSTQFSPELVPRANKREAKDGRMKEIIRDFASRFIERESNRISLITVTRVEMSPSGKDVTIFISVLPQNKEAGVIDFLKRKRGEFRGFVMETSRLPRVPFFDFVIDEGEKNRQKIDEISRQA